MPRGASGAALAVTTYQIGKLFLIGAPAPDHEPWRPRRLRGHIQRLSIKPIYSEVISCIGMKAR
jgi:hypothetical protein